MTVVYQNNQTKLEKKNKDTTGKVIQKNSGLIFPIIYSRLQNKIRWEMIKNLQLKQLV